MVVLLAKAYLDNAQEPVGAALFKTENSTADVDR
jgi:hypothetical protein